MRSSRAVIQTITKRGYRLIAPVEVVTVPAEPSPVWDAAAMAAAADAVEGAGDEAPRSFWQRLKLSAMRAAIGAPSGASWFIMQRSARSS